MFARKTPYDRTPGHRHRRHVHRRRTGAWTGPPQHQGAHHLTRAGRRSAPRCARHSEQSRRRACGGEHDHPRHHARHQRDHRTARREDRAAGHRGVPRLGRDGVRKPLRAVRHLHGQARAAGAAHAASAGARAHRCARQRGAPARRSCARGAGADVAREGDRERRHRLSARLCVSATRTTRARPTRQARARAVDHAVLGSEPRDPRVRALVDRLRQRLCATDHGRLSRPTRSGITGARVELRAVSDDFRRRAHHRRAGAQAAGAAGRIGSGGRRDSRLAHRHTMRLRSGAVVRHGRHHREDLPDRRWRAAVFTHVRSGARIPVPEGKRIAAAHPGGGDGRDRRRWRLDCVCRCNATHPGRPGERRLGAWSGVLRTRRRAPHGDRRRRRARSDRPWSLRRRLDPARHGGVRARDRTRHRRSARLPAGACRLRDRRSSRGEHGQRRARACGGARQGTRRPHADRFRRSGTVARGATGRQAGHRSGGDSHRRRRGLGGGVPARAGGLRDRSHAPHTARCRVRFRRRECDARRDAARSRARGAHGRTRGRPDRRVDRRHALSRPGTRSHRRDSRQRVRRIGRDRALRALRRRVRADFRHHHSRHAGGGDELGAAAGGADAAACR